MAKVETREFQAETKRLLDLMINSLYTHKEIFLRELVSNASDAIDRLRFESLTNKSLVADNTEFQIRLETDPSKRTFTIHDNGIGMSREEVITNIGTIAKSGTREMMDALKKSKESGVDIDLIGQFGVGFYSSFMVADRIELLTRRAGETLATTWSSAGDGTYVVGEGKRESFGTSITLHLKPIDKDAGLEDFTSEWVLSRIIKKYSDFVTYPIRMEVEREKEVYGADGKASGDKTTEKEVRTLNSMKAIWTRPQSEVGEEEYFEFYKHVAHDWNQPLLTIQTKGEGTVEFWALLFVPTQAPNDLFYIGSKPSLQLYVRKVKIMDECEPLIPHYLRFVKGVIDASDLPLNVSREMLQHDRQIHVIKKHLVKKVLTFLGELLESDRKKYKKFWRQFGKAIKEGATSDFDNKEKLLSLCLFPSSASEKELATLKEYVGRMKEGQNEIFYMTGESREMIESSPHLEAFKEKGYEVLFLTDHVDELFVQQVMEFEERKLKSVEKGEIDLGKDEDEKKKAKEELEQKEEEHKAMLEALQKKLDEHVKQVRLTNRLTHSPVCLVGANHDYSPRMERLLQKGEGGGPAQRRIMELNPSHELLRKMKAAFEADPEDELLDNYAELLLAMGLLAEGGKLPDVGKITKLVAEVMVRAA